MSIVETHPEVAAQWHPTKNGYLDVKLFRAGSNIKVWWLCPNSCKFGCLHEWTTRVTARCYGKMTGCPFCAINHNKRCIHSSIAYTHPEVAAQWHPTKNGNLKASDVSYQYDKKVWWLCDKTCPQKCPHEWKTSVGMRCYKKRGCPYCGTSNENTSKQRICEHVSIKYTHPEIAAEWHPTKNNNLKPTDVSNGSGKKVWWKCSKNKSHEWESATCHRTKRNSGCPYCINKTEGILLEYLQTKFTDVITQFKIDECKNINLLPFDFYIPSQNTIIELDGGQHFTYISKYHKYKSLEDTQHRDIYKMKFALDKGYKFIRIFQEDVFNNNEAWLDKNLLPYITSLNDFLIYISKNSTLYDIHDELLSEAYNPCPNFVNPLL